MSFEPLPLDFYHRLSVGYVAKSISKRKARCRTLRPAQSGPVDSRADLRIRIQRVPGLEEHVDLLSHVLRSWRYLGEVSDATYFELLQSIPQKRIEVPGDLRDPSRLGPGHMSSIDALRARARQEALQEHRLAARRQAANEFKLLLGYTRPIAHSRSWTRLIE